MTVPVLSTDIDEQKPRQQHLYLRGMQDVRTAHWKIVAKRANRTPRLAGSWYGKRIEQVPASFGDEIVCARGSARPQAD